jgi:mono/diheme cytochrome c family protein
MSIMPSFASRLNDDQMNDMVNFLSSLSTRKASPAPAGETSETSQQEGVSGPASNASGIQSAGIIGDREHGAILFHQSCIMCHGPHGNTQTSGFAAPKGVPSLNPIDHAVFNADSQTFVEHIDQFIQHGIPNTEGGPNMPNFGDSHALTQAQIADLEAYVLSLNGVDRTKIMDPGIEPKEFFYSLVAISSVIVMLATLYWFLMKLLKV